MLARSSAAKKEEFAGFSPGRYVDGAQFDRLGGEEYEFARRKGTREAFVLFIVGHRISTGGIRAGPDLSHGLWALW